MTCLALKQELHLCGGQDTEWKDEGENSMTPDRLTLGETPRKRLQSALQTDTSGIEGKVQIRWGGGHSCLQPQAALLAVSLADIRKPHLKRGWRKEGPNER